LGRTPETGEEIPANLPEALPSFLLTQRDQTPISATLILLQHDRPVTFVKGVRKFGANGHPLGASSPNDLNRFEAPYQ
jgi:hypothetical protein